MFNFDYVYTKTFSNYEIAFTNLTKKCSVDKPSE